MALQIVSRSLVVDGFAVLTPDLFAEIDAVAKSKAGRPFSIFDHREKSNWGQCNFMVSSVFTDLAMIKTSCGEPGLFAEMGVLEIANEVNVAKFHAADRPEIDLSKIPADRIHEYVAYHEIGHVLDNYNSGKGMFTADREHAKVNEVLADRFAWAAMFPGFPVPVRVGCENIDAWLVEQESRLLQQGITKGRPRRSLPNDSLKNVPTEHVRKRIPWSRKLRGTRFMECQLVVDLNRAKAGLRAYDMRCFKRTAREMAKIWAEVAKKPDAYAMRLHKEHRSMLSWKPHKDLVHGAARATA